MRRTFFSGLAMAAFVGASVSSVSASAAILYNNSPSAYGSAYATNAWTLDYGYAVADSFTLSGPATVTGIDFVSWNYPGDTLQSIDWAITTAPFSGTIASGTASLSSSFIETNGYGYQISENSFSLTQNLAGGTYWLQFQNAVVGNGDPIYWDINSGPSLAWHNTLGDVSHGSCVDGAAYSCSS